MTLYLDVDGVLNPSSPRFHHWNDWTPHVIDVNKDGGLVLRFNLHLSVEQGKAIWDAADGDITWLSTWNQDNLANREIGKRLNWTPLFTLPYMEHEPDGRWWKWITLENAERPDRWVWIDDDLADFPDAAKWASENGGLTICPDYAIGITPRHVDLIADWLN